MYKGQGTKRANVPPKYWNKLLGNWKCFQSVKFRFLRAES